MRSFLMPTVALRRVDYYDRKVHPTDDLKEVAHMEWTQTPETVSPDAYCGVQACWSRECSADYYCGIRVCLNKFCIWDY